MNITTFGSSAFNAILLFDLDYVELLSNTARGVDLAVSMTGSPTGRILNNSIEASEVALGAPGFHNGHVAGNTLSGDEALSLGSGNRIHDNLAEGGAFGAAAVVLHSENRFSGNVIRASHQDYGLVVLGA